MSVAARPLRPMFRLAVPVLVAVVVVSLTLINIALVRTTVGAIGSGMLFDTRRHGLYYSLAIIGILAIVTGTSVRLRRPADQATFHFFWLTTVFCGALAFTLSGRRDPLDVFFGWAHTASMLLLPPLFLQFSFTFPERPDPWVRTDASRAIMPIVYVPALLLAGARATMVARAPRGVEPFQVFGKLDLAGSIYLWACVVGGLFVIVRALTRLRSVTAHRQRRWIVWGSTAGAVPIVMIYLVPFLFGQAPPYAEYTAVLLGAIPLAFASALARYRLTDIEVLVRKALVVAAFVMLLVVIYYSTLTLVGVISGPSEEQSHFWALFATLIVALVAPWLWQAIKAALDRVYNPARYDYRRALVTFARELNSDLDLARLSTNLVARVRETLGVDRIALMLADPADEGGNFIPIASGGFGAHAAPTLVRTSALGARIKSGQTVVIDDQVPMRRLAGEEAAAWREAGLYCFVPCVSNDITTAVMAVGRKAGTELVSGEDLALLGAVAGQAATALENARLYAQLRSKADEIERLRQFSDSVVESLSDGLVVVDLDDRVLRWNKGVEGLVGVERGKAIGRHFPALFESAFVERVYSARSESPANATLYRVPLTSGQGADKRTRLVNAGIAPFRTADGSQAGWIIVLEDITDRANLEEQLRLSEKMAAIGLLAAGVAHEVNTPLTGISSFTQMLLDRSDPADPNIQLLEKIERQTFRAAKIVNSLLNLARPSGGEAGPVDLNGVIGDVLSLLEHQFRTSRIQVRKEFATPILTVRGEEYKLQQVFLNLFLNARDAMQKGGWLSVSSRIDGDDAIVDVADTGVGIPAEHVSRIYDPFFTTKGEGRGTGLGLSVTYGIVQEHHGTLTCESDLGQGTHFRLVLPLLDQSATQTAASK